jgi:hypothetical protein
VQIKEILDEEEAVERVLAYVIMNCVAANICAHPSQYPYGTGNCFFSLMRLKGTRLGDLSGRERERILHSGCDKVPMHWRVGPDGFILPQDYVDIEAVERCFRRPVRFDYFLRHSSKAKKRLEAVDEHLPAFRDQVIIAALPDLCRSLFGKETFGALSPEEQTEMMRQIRFRFSADVNQIARVCGVSYSDAAKILDKV